MARRVRQPAGTMAVSDFKARCLEMLERVRRRGEEIVLTNHGEPIARVTPIGRGESPDTFMDELDRSPRLAILPITPRVALESTRLGPAFHRDPADQLIAATARVHGLRLVTADERTRRSGVVAVV